MTALGVINWCKVSPTIMASDVGGFTCIPATAPAIVLNQRRRVCVHGKESPDTGSFSSGLLQARDCGVSLRFRIQFSWIAFVFYEFNERLGRSTPRRLRQATVNCFHCFFVKYSLHHCLKTSSCERWNLFVMFGQNWHVSMRVFSISTCAI